jgi:hypothetical protein
MKRMVTVLRPEFKPFPHGLSQPRVTPRMNDYMSVPHIDTIGGWRFRELLTPAEIKALADLANVLEKKQGKAPRRGMRDETVRWRA